MTENIRNNMVVGGGKNKTAASGDDRNGNKTTTSSSEMIIKREQQEFVPIKGRVRQLEDDSSKQAKNEDNFKKAAHKNGNNGKVDKVEEVDNGNSNCDPQQTSDDSEDSNKLEHQGETKFNIPPPTVAVPTPLPRTSRNNSMTDPSSSEESTGSPRPSPMPRVTIGSGYKVLNNNQSFPKLLFCFRLV